MVINKVYLLNKNTLLGQPNKSQKIGLCFLKMTKTIKFGKLAKRTKSSTF